MKKLTITACLALVFSAAASSPAVAKDDAADKAKMRTVTAKYATCVVRKYHDKASEAILSMVNNGTINRQFQRILDADCLRDAAGYGYDMRFPLDTYRYALADALVNADFATRGETSFANRLPLAQPAIITPEDEAKAIAKAKGQRQRKEIENDIATMKSLGFLSRYGECVVRQDPVNARYWLLTPPETPEETSRVNALRSAFGACLDSGTIKLTRTLVRGIVAVSYYRLAMATVMPATGSKP